MTLQQDNDLTENIVDEINVVFVGFFNIEMKMISQSTSLFSADDFIMLIHQFKDHVTIAGLIGKRQCWT